MNQEKSVSDPVQFVLDSSASSEDEDDDRSENRNANGNPAATTDAKENLLRKLAHQSTDASDLGQPPSTPGAFLMTPRNIDQDSSFSSVDDVDDDDSDDQAGARAGLSELSAHLVDEEADQERIKEAVKSVLGSQKAVQVVDVEREEELRQKHQHQLKCVYFSTVMFLGAVLVVAIITNSRTVVTVAPTSVPTAAPTTRLSAVQRTIEERFGVISTINEEQETGLQQTPQERAIEWLTEHDESTISHSFPLDDDDARAMLYDRYAVTVLAFSTNYDAWVDNTNWLDPSKSVCEWQGLSCNDDGRISVLDLGNQNLHGTIPPELGVLDNLDFVYLFRNSLTGTIPSELGSLGDVDFMLLNENLLTGTIPDELSGLLDADDLYLFDNQLTGTIPDGFGGLVDLVNLYMHDNILSGTIPRTLGKLKRLQKLYLHNNSLTANIPSELGGIISLERLVLNDNALTGTVPSALGSFFSLSLLAVQGNHLTGSIPHEVCELRDTTTIDKLEVLTADCTQGVTCLCCTECF